MRKKTIAKKVKELSSLYEAKKQIKITAELILEQEGGFTVYCPELNIYSQGENVQDAIRNIREAVELHIEEIGINNQYEI